ncbi:MAG: metal-dependent phosphohydrolase [Treponema sp.]|jgi:HD-GYP domain-containing protein (c-di-GMP phosphodiesterase class II)|nr:metal-dependent phosphohydrolase [Treponema sp.]
MTEKNMAISLSKVLPDGQSVNKEYINIILEEDIPVLCLNRGSQKKRLMPFKVLYDNNGDFWQKPGGGWEYYLTGDDYKKLKEKATAASAGWNKEVPKAKKTAKTDKLTQVNKDEEELEEIEVEVGYGKEYKSFAQMSTEEKIECLNENKRMLLDLLSSKPRDETKITETLVNTTKDAALVNHTIISEVINLTDEEAKKATQEMVDSTQEMVKSSAQLIQESIFSNELMNTLVKESKGTIIQHMTRVYINGIAFISYYNKLVSASSAIQKIRIKFASAYRKFYSPLLPHMHLEDIDLESVFCGGMRAVPPDLYFKWAVGFLIHDIGKASAIEYHEGEAAYDRKIVIDHVKQGYKSITTKTNYPIEAALITGYHHEYYGDSDGYGYFRAYLQRYKKDNPQAKQDYCIAYELEPMMDYQALAYFPAKVLEIVDIFDSLTDPNRVYRKAMLPEDALKMMREEFIEKRPKIDIILFDLFSSFIHEKEAQAAA